MKEAEISYFFSRFTMVSLAELRPYGRPLVENLAIELTININFRESTRLPACLGLGAMKVRTSVYGCEALEDIPLSVARGQVAEISS